MAKTIRRKRGDTKVGTIEKQYGVDLGARSDKTLEQYLKDQGLTSLSRALKRADRNSSKK